MGAPLCVGSLGEKTRNLEAIGDNESAMLLSFNCLYQILEKTRAAVQSDITLTES